MAETDPGSGRRRARARSIALPLGWRSLHVGLRPDWQRWRAKMAIALSTEIDRRRPFLCLPVFFAVGVIAYFRADTEPVMLAPVLAAVPCLLIAIFGRARFGMQAAALACLAVFAGFAAGIVRTASVAAPVLTSPVFVTIDGWVESIDWTGQGGRMVLRLHDVTPAIDVMPERIRLTFRGRPAVESGQGLRLRARLSPPPPAAVPGGFDFAREAYFLRLGAVGFVTGPVTIRTDLPVAPLESRLAAGVDRARNALNQRIIAVIGGATGAIASALVTGKRGMIPEVDNEAMRAAGIYHIISISGLHMVLAAGLFFVSVRLILVAIPSFALRYPVKKWAAIAAMFGAIAYCLFSGSEVATLRSLIMTLVLFAAILFDRPALAMRNLAIAALIVMALEPETILGPSFQMSFAAVAALVAWGEWDRARRNAPDDTVQDEIILPRSLRRAFLVLLITAVVAGLATAPFQAFHFSRLNPYGVLGNALAIPVCSLLVMPAALGAVVLVPFGLDAPLWWLMGQGVVLIQVFAGWVAQLDGAVVLIGRYGAGALALMALGIAILTIATLPVFRIAGGAVAMSGIALAATADRPVAMIDPSGRTVLVRSEKKSSVLVGPDRPSFVLSQWLPGYRDARTSNDPGLTNGALCDRSGCAGPISSGQSVAVVLQSSAFDEDCERAAVIVTPLVAPENCRKSTMVFDRRHFEAYGATMLYLNGVQLITETARTPSRRRPWIPARDAPPPVAPPLTAGPAVLPAPWDLP